MTNWLQVKMRFPTMDSLVEAKLLLPHEADRLEKVDFRLNEEMMWITAIMFVIFKKLNLNKEMICRSPS